MSVAGLKKQLHKATQRVSEKVGGAEGTKLDDDFRELEKKVDVTSRAVLDIMTRTTEYLQPNPASRARLSMISTMSRIRGQEKGQEKGPVYLQAETVLGDAMRHFGHKLGDQSSFGLVLLDAGEALRELGEVKDSLDLEVKQKFIDPLQDLQDKDVKEIQHHIKKMEGRRLDFDYKRRRPAKVQEDDVRLARDKFDDSKLVAEQSMFNLIERDVEQVLQLQALLQAQLQFHTRSFQLLQQLATKMEDRIKEVSSRPRKEFSPKPRTVLELLFPRETPNGGQMSSRTPSKAPAPIGQPCCRAIYDFAPENEGELGFKEGDVITLTNQIDDNWYEGTNAGQSGFFPANYVEILVALPH